MIKRLYEIISLLAHGNRATALDELEKVEWAMGNGQCHHCCGLDRHWVTRGPHRIGHKKDCVAAKTIILLGGSTILLGAIKYKDFTKEEQVHFIEDIIRWETSPFTFEQVEKDYLQRHES